MMNPRKGAHHALEYTQRVRDPHCVRSCRRTAKRPVTDAARDFKISRRTAYKWLARFDAGLPLADHSRRPLASPTRTTVDLEAAVLEVRDRYG